MTKRSDYDALIEDVAKMIEFRRYKAGPANSTSAAIAVAVLAVVRAWLATITPAMRKARRHARAKGSQLQGEAEWLAMLAASPLAEGQSATVRKDGE